VNDAKCWTVKRDFRAGHWLEQFIPEQFRVFDHGEQECNKFALTAQSDKSYVLVMPETALGVRISIYFRTAKDLRRVRQAARVLGVRPTAMMRDVVMAEAERVIEKSKLEEK
jgi:hypothetical protein